MYLLLLVFGGVLSAAGIVLAASGVSIHDRTFDPTLVTPGVVAGVGGLLLIGLGLALRVLQRIERALAQRQVVIAREPGEPAQIPLPKPARRPLAAAPAVSAGETHAEGLPERASPLARLETTRVVEETELSVSPIAAPVLPTSVDVAVAEAEKAHPIKRKNGAAPTRLTPRLDMTARLPGASERPAGPSFDALWPKGPRPVRDAPPAPVQATAAPAAEPEQITEPAEDTTQIVAPDATPGPEPVSVLKSGVVDGMAYTLYSDGSIEAQLPQGMLRFGSITELRNHIEQSA
jgi:hypothetical protein